MNPVNRLHAARIDYTDTTTVGAFAVNGTLWGYTLEDRARPPGKKIGGRTCIPAGTYKVRVTRSPRFGRWMPELLDVPGFSGVRLHGGNRHTDTEGCPLIAANRPEREKVQGSLEPRLMAFLRAQIRPRPDETEAEYWARLPETWYTVQEGPSALPGPSLAEPERREAP